MTRRNPFSYPESMGWLPYMAHVEPGNTIWVVLQQADYPKQKSFTFIMRENSHMIKALPMLPSGGVPIEFRMGVVAIETSSGTRVPILIVMISTPAGISEVTVNALHVDDEAVQLAGESIVMMFVGDTKSVERTLVFGPNDALQKNLSFVREIYDRNPWTDDDFNEAKQIYEQSTDLNQLWNEMAVKR